MRLAYAAYAVLAVSVWILTATAHLDGYWRTLAAAMLVGYCLAPRAIFRLCADTHAAQDDDDAFPTHHRSHPHELPASLGFRNLLKENRDLDGRRFVRAADRPDLRFPIPGRGGRQWWCGCCMASSARCTGSWRTRAAPRSPV